MLAVAGLQQVTYPTEFTLSTESDKFAKSLKAKGIPAITANALARHFGSIDEIMWAPKHKLSGMKGVGIKGFRAILDMLNAMLKY